MATHSSILAWEIHGQRNLVSCSPRGCKELSMTERLHLHFQSLCKSPYGLIFNLMSLSSLRSSLSLLFSSQACLLAAPSCLQPSSSFPVWAPAVPSPWSERSPREGNGYPLQYCCLENSMGRGTWQGPWGRKESDTTEQLPGPRLLMSARGI